MLYQHPPARGIDYYKVELDKIIIKYRDKLPAEKAALQTAVKDLFNDKNLSIQNKLELFKYLYENKEYWNAVNLHRSKLDCLYHVKMTASWTKVLGEIRKSAIDSINAELRNIESSNEGDEEKKQHKLDLAEQCKKSPLFNLHKHNSWLWGAYGKTQTVDRISTVIDSVKEFGNHSKARVLNT